MDSPSPSPRVSARERRTWPTPARAVAREDFRSRAGVPRARVPGRARTRAPPAPKARTPAPRAVPRRFRAFPRALPLRGESPALLEPPTWTHEPPRGAQAAEVAPAGRQLVKEHRLHVARQWPHGAAPMKSRQQGDVAAASPGDGLTPRGRVLESRLRHPFHSPSPQPRSSRGSTSRPPPGNAPAPSPGGGLKPSVNSSVARKDAAPPRRGGLKTGSRKKPEDGAPTRVSFAESPKPERGHSGGLQRAAVGSWGSSVRSGDSGSSIWRLPSGDYADVVPAPREAPGTAAVDAGGVAAPVDTGLWGDGSRTPRSARPDTQDLTQRAFEVANEVDEAVSGATTPRRSVTQQAYPAAAPRAVSSADGSAAETAIPPAVLDFRTAPGLAHLLRGVQRAMEHLCQVTLTGPAQLPAVPAAARTELQRKADQQAAIAHAAKSSLDQALRELRVAAATTKAPAKDRRRSSPFAGSPQTRKVAESLSPRPRTSPAHRSPLASTGSVPRTRAATTTHRRKASMESAVSSPPSAPQHHDAAPTATARPADGAVERLFDLAQNLAQKNESLAGSLEALMKDNGRLQAEVQRERALASAARAELAEARERSAAAAATVAREVQTDDAGSASPVTTPRGVDDMTKTLTMGSPEQSAGPGTSPESAKEQSPGGLHHRTRSGQLREAMETSWQEVQEMLNVSEQQARAVASVMARANNTTKGPSGGVATEDYWIKQCKFFQAWAVKLQMDAAQSNRELSKMKVTVGAVTSELRSIAMANTAKLQSANRLLRKHGEQEIPLGDPLAAIDAALPKAQGSPRTPPDSRRSPPGRLQPSLSRRSRSLGEDDLLRMMENTAQQPESSAERRRRKYGRASARMVLDPIPEFRTRSGRYGVEGRTESSGRVRPSEDGEMSEEPTPNAEAAMAAAAAAERMGWRAHPSPRASLSDVTPMRTVLEDDAEDLDEAGSLRNTSDEGPTEEETAPSGLEEFAELDSAVPTSDVAAAGDDCLLGKADDSGPDPSSSA
ncbi:unnamed protein product [Pedinophyceae sp. YPF-701]|nr:unnamed protein product [Pedinophyceae sp. YPF-701]